MVDQAEIRVDIEGNLAWVVLDSPPGNLLDAESAERLTQTLQHLDADDSVDAVALTGGGTNFCAGVNIPKLVKTETVQAFARAPWTFSVISPWPASRSSPPSTVMRWQAGSACCAARTSLLLPTMREWHYRGQPGTWPALAKIPGLHRVPPKAMITNCLTGVPFSAQRAYELNIVDEIVPLDQLRARVRDYAELAVRGGTAARAGRALFYRAAALPLAEGLSEGAKLFVSSFS